MIKAKLKSQKIQIKEIIKYWLYKKRLNLNLIKINNSMIEINIWNINYKMFQ